MATKRGKAPARKAQAKKATKKRSTTKPAVRGLGLSRREEQEYRAQDDLRVLRQAADIQSDKSRLTAAQKMADREMRALERVRGKS